MTSTVKNRGAGGKLNTILGEYVFNVRCVESADGIGRRGRVMASSYAHAVAVFVQLKVHEILHRSVAKSTVASLDLTNEERTMAQNDDCGIYRLANGEVWVSYIADASGWKGRRESEAEVELT